MYLYHRSQRGFSLIEALIAFIVLAVGLLGAAIFHSRLVKESGASKAESFAIKLAEERLETLRRFKTKDEYLSLIASNAGLGLQPVSTVSGINADFHVANAFTTVSSVASNSVKDLNKVKVVVSWADPSDGNTASISLSSYIAWLNPVEEINVTEAGIGKSGSGIGSIELPTGNAEAVTRVSMGPTSAAAGTVVASGAERGVALANGDSVKLIKLKSSSEPVMKIVGTVINNPDKPVSLPFGYYNSSDIAGGGITDVGASAGGNCAIVRIYHAGDTIGTGSYGFDFADYVCLMGEGWAGNIGIYKNQTDVKKQFEDENRLACMQTPRGYKYNIVSLNNVDTFAASTSTLSDVTIVGQSGMVRLYDDGVSTHTQWNDYFWHNDKLINPASAPYGSTWWGTLEGGDVINQPFVVTKTTGGTDCTDAVNSVKAATTPTPDPRAIPDPFPGDPAVYDKNNQNGKVILGYAPERFQISGQVRLDSSATLPVISQFHMVGNPEPTVSITCDVASTATSGTGFKAYDYSCGVPVNWSGAIVVQPASAAAGGVYGCPDDNSAGGVLTGITDYYGASLAVDSTDSIAFKYFKNVDADITNTQNNFAFSNSMSNCSNIVYK